MHQVLVKHYFCFWKKVMYLTSGNSFCGIYSFLQVENVEIFILGWPAASRGLLLRQSFLIFFNRILFHYVPKFRNVLESLSFSPNFLFHRVPKFRDIQEDLSFSPEFCSIPYQNSGTYRRVFLFHQNFVP